MKTGKLLLATAVTSLLTLTLSAPVMANGTGDLYVASQAGVLEVLVKSSSVINTIPMLPVPLSVNTRRPVPPSDGSHTRLIGKVPSGST